MGSKAHNHCRTGAVVLIQSPAKKGLNRLCVRGRRHPQHTPWRPANAARGREAPLRRPGRVAYSILISSTAVLLTHAAFNYLGHKVLFSEKNIHLAFDASLWLKLVFALGEIASGIATYFVSRAFLVQVVLWVTKGEFAEDPRDLVANSLLHTAQHFSVGAQEFAAIYLLAHGVIKLWLIIGLLRKRLWCYPTAIVAFGLFVAYQVYRYTFTHSVLLILITILDIIVIGLTWHEWRYLSPASGPD